MTTVYTDEDLVNLSTKLLTHIEQHLTTQFSKGRIEGTDYAQVYIAGIQASMSQAQSFLLNRDVAAGQANLLAEQHLQAANQTVISNATVNDQISLISNQKLLLDEQLTQALIQGNIVDEQGLQAILQTTVIANQKEIAVATKQGQIDTVVAQANLSKEQLLQAVVQTNILNTQKDVTTATKQDNIDGVAAKVDLTQEQLAQSVVQTSILNTQQAVALAVKPDQIASVTATLNLTLEELIMMRERHGMNLTAQYT